MRSRHRPVGFRSTGAALARAVCGVGPDIPPWPDLAEPSPERVTSVVDWLRKVWAFHDVAEALDHASPVLAEQVAALLEADDPSVRRTFRAALSVARYLRRMVGRPTPFGLLSGVAPAAFGPDAHVCWGSGHRAVARAGARWLGEVVAQLEGCAALLARLPVVANTTMTVRGDRLVVPYQPQVHPGRGPAAVEVSLRHTPAVRAAVEGARAPIRFEDLAAKVQAEFPHAAAAVVTAMLTELVTRGALITSLHAPATQPDALGHVLQQLAAADPHLRHHHLPRRPAPLYARWRVENLFKYLDFYGIDHIADYHATIATNTRPVDNPARAAARNTLKTLKAQRDELHAAIGAAHTDQTLTIAALNTRSLAAQRKIRQLDKKITAATAALKPIPTKLPANVVDPDAQRAVHRAGRRCLQMVLRLLAHNAEHWLAHQLNAYLQDTDTYRATTRNLLHLAGIITYTPTTIHVDLDKPATPKLTRALTLLLRQINTTPPHIPGDPRPITYTIKQA